MAGKIPPNAFATYLSLGAGRSYGALAERLGVSKRAITKLAGKEGWQDRLSGFEQDALRDGSDGGVSNQAEVVNQRHLRILQLIEHKALQTLKDSPLQTASDATKALLTAIREERSLSGLGNAVAPVPGPEKKAALDLAQAKKAFRKEYPGWSRAIVIVANSMGVLDRLIRSIKIFEKACTASHPSISMEYIRNIDGTLLFLRWMSTGDVTNDIQSISGNGCILELWV